MGAVNRNLRDLPSIDRVLQSAEVVALKARWLSRLVDDEVRDLVAERRDAIRAGKDPGDLGEAALAIRAGERLAQRLAPGTVRCLNATGVVLHTGLGRAVLPPAAREALQRELKGYTRVSVDRASGARLRRETTCAAILCALTGAEAATIVNNNAAATLIALNTLAAGREAILSRGQLVEIGGSFRMPEVFQAAGVRLKEVGTTNRTHLRDYTAAIGNETALLLRVHPSNYQVTGFTSEPAIEELGALGAEREIPLMDDLGAGALIEMAPEPEVAASLRAGSAVVTCSGDKLIGGPQSGILLGKREWIEKIRRNPLFRALRVGKLTLIALEATLRLFLRPDGPGADHPSRRMLGLSKGRIEEHARSLANAIEAACPGLGVELRPEFSQVGSGSMPGESLPTTLLCLAHGELPPSRFARALRGASTPVYTRIADDQVCLDPRTLQPGEDPLLIEMLRETTRSS